MKNIIAFLILFSCGAVHARDLNKLYSKADFKIGTQKFSAYVADDEERRAQGLMFIEKMPENTGMLFVFEDERVLGFWMKNTLIPLSIGFFDAKGVLIDIQEMKVAASIMEVSPPSYKSNGAAAFALEMNTGWFAKHGIKTGSHLVRLTKSNSTLLNEKLPLPKSTRH
ncbi:MAG: DUF192 domain-containing protein [Bdellovibrionales bacterium]